MCSSLALDTNVKLVVLIRRDRELDTSFRRLCFMLLWGWVCFHRVPVLPSLMLPYPLHTTHYHDRRAHSPTWRFGAWSGPPTVSHAGNVRWPAGTISDHSSSTHSLPVFGMRMSAPPAAWQAAKLPSARAGPQTRTVSGSGRSRVGIGVRTTLCRTLENAVLPSTTPAMQLRHLGRVLASICRPERNAGRETLLSTESTSARHDRLPWQNVGLTSAQFCQ